MTDHPLTDKICDEITSYIKLKISDTNNMRAAADWQLERDADYFLCFLVDEFGITPASSQQYIREFKQRMRPQQLEDN